MEFKQVAESVIASSGGVGNISSITHCSTRLRFFIRDNSKVDMEKIQNTKPVLGVVFKGDELQIILGQNLIPVYSEAVKIYDMSGADGMSKDAVPATKEKLSVKKAVDIVVGFVSASVTPLIPGLVAGGMLKVFLLLITLVYAAFEESQAYALLSMLADMPFYFMPVFVAYGASKKLGATPLYSMSVASVLVYSNFVALLGGEDPVSIFRLPVMVVKYNSTLLPALLITLFAYYCEKILSKIIPGILKSVFVGMLTMVLTFTAGITVLGPLGDILGSYVVNIFLFTSAHFGPVAIALLAACMPWLVMTGMHHAVTPFMVQAFADPGYDVFFRPSYILHNMAEGGACIGVGLRTKDKTLKAECFSLAFGCIVAGVTEPAIYGVNFRLRKPMIGVMAGGAAGGIVAGIMGATAYVYGYSTILALPIFQDTIMAMAAGIIVDIVVAAIVTFFLGIDEDVSAAAREHVRQSESALPEKREDIKELKACVDGKTMELADVRDGVFSEKMLGDGLAAIPAGNQIVSPADGTICTVADSKHAVGVQLDNGVQLLIHIGIDTVSMNGKGFEVFVKEGERVACGQKLAAFDREEIKKAGYQDTVMMIVTENTDNIPLRFMDFGDVKAGGDTVIKFSN